MLVERRGQSGNRRRPSDPALDGVNGVLPAQFFHASRISTPEQRLWLALLEEAIHTYKKYPHDHRYFRDAETWLLEDATDVAAFRSVCELLGFDPDAVRAAIVQQRHIDWTFRADVATLAAEP